MTDADLQFNEDQEFARPTAAAQSPVLARLVLKTGIVSTREQANYALLGIAVIGILFTFFMLFSGGSMSAPHPVFKEGQNVLVSPGAPMP